MPPPCSHCLWPKYLGLGIAYKSRNMKLQDEDPKLHCIIPNMFVQHEASLWAAEGLGACLMMLIPKPLQQCISKTADGLLLSGG